MTTRRDFLTGMSGILAAGVAPGWVRAGILMPCKGEIITPGNEIIDLRKEMGFSIERAFVKQYEENVRRYLRQVSAY